MPYTWIKDVENLYATLDIEDNAKQYVASHREGLRRRLTDSIVLLSRPNEGEFINKALDLSETERTCYALCQMAISAGKLAIQENEPSAEEDARLVFFTKKYFDKVNTGGFLASLKSDSLRLMNIAERLGRSNVADGQHYTHARYDYYLTRLQCEALYPNFMQELYKTFLPEERLLTAEQQREIAKTEIREYLTKNTINENAKIVLGYTDIISLIGHRSLLSLFSDGNSTTEDEAIQTNILNLVRNRTLLSALSGNTHLPLQDSAGHILEAIEIFNVLSSYPYSTVPAATDGGSDEAVPLPQTQSMINHLSPESYQQYKTICQSVKSLLAALRFTMSEHSPQEMILINNLLEHHTGRTLARVFDVFFTAAINKQKLEEECAKHDYNLAQWKPADEQQYIQQENSSRLLVAIAEFRAIAGDHPDIKPEKVVPYLDFLSSLATTEPQVALNLLAQPLENYWDLGHVIAGGRDAVATDRYLDVLSELAKKHPNEVLILLTQGLSKKSDSFSLRGPLSVLDLITATEIACAAKCGHLVASLFAKAVRDKNEGDDIDAQYFKPIIQKSLMALDATPENLTLLKDFRDDPQLQAFCTTPTGSPTLASLSGKTTATLTTKINTKIASIEAQLPSPPSPTSTTTCASLTGGLSRNDSRPSLQNLWSTLTGFTKVY